VINLQHIHLLLIILGKYRVLLYKIFQLIKMKSTKNIIILCFLIIISFIITGCNGKLPGGDARKFPADPKKRIEQNLKQGKGFQLNDVMMSRGGTFDFASSNSLWRASLDIIDFMPLSSVNYSGGIIITDWYSENDNLNESIKISIRFLTNELRSDALDIKVFKRKCLDNLFNCKFIQTDETLILELKKEILKKAALYKKQDKEKKK